MDPVLWSLLPTALVELVLGKLPFLRLIRMRLVCKAWNSLIVSEGFSPPNPNPKSLLLHCFLMTQPGFDGREEYRHALVAYDTEKGSWRKLFFNCPHEIIREGFSWPRLVATAGGLLCFEIHSPAYQTFIVCNPISNTWKRLPCMELQPQLSSGSSSGTSIRWRVAGLAYDEQCRSYKLVVAGFCREDRDEGQNWFLKGTQVYDSAAESWTLTLQDREIMGGSGSFKNAFNKSVFWKNHLYVVTSMDFGCGHDVAIFSMKKGTWIEVPAFDFTQDEAPAHLVLHEGQVLLVAEEWLEFGTQTLGFWKLNISDSDLEAMWSPSRADNGNPWLKLKSVDRYQRALPLYAGKSLSLDWACVGHRNFTSFICCTEQFPRPMHIVCVHDLGQNSWRQLPNTGHVNVDNPCNACAFEPSLSSSV